MLAKKGLQSNDHQNSPRIGSLLINFQKSETFASFLFRSITTIKRWPGSLDILIFIISFGLYFNTLSPSVYTFDSAEFATGAYSLGIVHDTGYPLYLMLAKLFTLIIPIGDIAYRVNMFSAVCAALSLVFIRRVAFIISGSASTAILATAMLGVSYPLWSEAVVAEVYTLHIFFLSIILWLALRWRGGGGDKFLILLSLIHGLSFGNHMSSVLVLPGIIYLIWEALKQKRVSVPRASTWILAVALFLVGPLTYIYLPIRYAVNPALNYAIPLGLDLSTLEGVLSMMRGQTFAHLYFGYSLAEVPLQIWYFLVLLWETFLGVGLILAVVGIIDIWGQDRSMGIALSMIVAINSIFYINYGAFDINRMFLPIFVILSLWMAGGMRALQERIAPIKLRRSVLWGGLGLIGLMLILNYPRVDLSENWITYQFAEEVFDQAPPDALIIGGWVDITPLQYFQIVERQRADVILFDYGLYALGRTKELNARSNSEIQTWRIIQGEIRQVVIDHTADGRQAFLLGDIEGFQPIFDQEPFSKWLYSITPNANYQSLPPP